uniref:succinyl-CoA ligase [GDP-forming] subunit beta, mitochondrial n=1 Tax=Solea senegalensis TaxID=28829 RepID=UPI001CD8D0AC|nr:succinyl-CoA ligase [GDP-forming] subunit beta, mitochondrial [Solea senegalensis]
MKCFERVVLAHIQSSIPDSLDPLQYAYRPNRSTTDAITAVLHHSLSHLENKESYIRILFVDYSSAFNTVIPYKLTHKLSTLGIHPTLCDWLLDFLTAPPTSRPLTYEWLATSPPPLTLEFRVNMAASMASQAAAKGLRSAASKHRLLDKIKCTWLSPRRWLNLQEYQSKKLMQESGVAVQRFYVADTASEALEAAKRLNAKEIVLKAQILAGGRGKGVFDSGLKGGVHLTKDPAVVGELANKMLGFNLTTKQTPKDGVKVNTVMVAEALDISRETYFAILMDRACNGPVMVGSPQGGMDIEEVAASTPELIFKEVIDIFEGVRDDQALRMADNLGFKGPLQRQAADQIKRLYDLFLKVDATQVEVNPLGETPEGQVVCFDAKINFDDNAEFRQKAVFAMDDMMESDPIEMEAAKWDLKYIGLDGNIACFVNGAGLAMATCDIIDLHGGKPANFLDLGGGVQERQVYEAFKLLTADPKVEAILVNIFGGIVNCAIIANGITKACRELELKVPLVVRLEGTNVHEAKRILTESGLPITAAQDLDDAAKKAVAAIKK